VSKIIAFEPHRFAGAAAYYVEGRPAYADRLIERVSDALGFDGTQRLLDVGTGPGQLAIAFAPHVHEAVAIDPEPEMLRIAAEQARGAGVRLSLSEGSSYTLNEDLGHFDLVLFGRSFHWTDRKATLQTLDRLVTPDGAVALFSTRHPQGPDNAWEKDFDALRDIHAEPNSHRPIMRAPDWTPHEAVLLDSPFDTLERISVIERRATPVEHFVARILSLAATSPGRTLTPADELAAAVRKVLAPYAIDGRVAEVVESEALLAFRRGSARVREPLRQSA